MPEKVWDYDRNTGLPYQRDEGPTAPCMFCGKPVEILPGCPLVCRDCCIALLTNGINDEEQKHD